MVYIFFNVMHERQVHTLNTDLRAAGYILSYSTQSLMYFVTVDSGAAYTIVGSILKRSGILRA